MCLKHQLDAGRDWFSPDIVTWHTWAWIKLIGWHNRRDSLKKRGRKTFEATHEDERFGLIASPLKSLWHVHRHFRFHALHALLLVGSCWKAQKEINDSVATFFFVAPWDLEVTGLNSCFAPRQNPLSWKWHMHSPHGHAPTHRWFYTTISGFHE